jgi:hypothetical protein
VAGSAQRLEVAEIVVHVVVVDVIDLEAIPGHAHGDDRVDGVSLDGLSIRQARWE